MSRWHRSVARLCARSFAVVVAAGILIGVLCAPAQARMEISIKPSSGPVGTSIKVTGSDYGANTVQIFWENDKGEYVLQGEATVDDNRNFSFTFKAPEGKAGDHRVKVTPKGSTNPNNDRSRPFKITAAGKAVQIKDGCTGVTHGDPFEVSGINVVASVDNAPEGAGFEMEIVAPDGTVLPIMSTVDENGRAAGSTEISTFGTYTADDPIVISFTDPNTGEEVDAPVDPSAVFPADGFDVGPEEVECTDGDVDPGLLLVEVPPESESPPPGTESEAPDTGPPAPVSADEGGVPVFWYLVIGGGVVLIGAGIYVVVVGGTEDVDLVHPGGRTIDQVVDEVIDHDIVGVGPGRVGKADCDELRRHCLEAQDAADEASRDALEARGKANAAQARCEDARTAHSRAVTELIRVEDRVGAQSGHPDIKPARDKVAEARERARTACDEAEALGKAADDAETEAREAQEHANDACRRADECEEQRRSASEGDDEGGAEEPSPGPEPPGPGGTDQVM